MESGTENLAPLGLSELKALTAERGEETVRRQRMRLACQARVQGDVTVIKQGVRPARPSALTLE